MRKFLALSLTTALLLACASGPEENNPPLQIQGMVIENQTPMWISAVRLLVPVTGNFVSCGNIPPESMCSTTFPETAYTGNPVEVTWSQGGQIHSTGQFTVRLPEQLIEDSPGVVRVVIIGPNSAGAFILQHPE